MSTSQEFHYRLAGRARDWHPGSHPGSSLGTGHDFVAHASLYDRPDPRRLDLRASLRDLQGNWLVRVNRQRASVAVHAVVDVSASMRFGSHHTKLSVAADFIEALSRSAYRTGDALGLLAFDSRERTDLYVPALRSRGLGAVMTSLLAHCAGGAGSVEGLLQAASHLAGRRGLVFVISDFHWPLQRLGNALDLLAHADVVPLIIWDPGETDPPARDALAEVHDVESGAHRTLWLRAAVRRRWRAAVAARRSTLDRIFAARSIRPFYVAGEFDGDQMSRYFFEAGA